MLKLKSPSAELAVVIQVFQTAIEQENLELIEETKEKLLQVENKRAAHILIVQQIVTLLNVEIKNPLERIILSELLNAMKKALYNSFDTTKEEEIFFEEEEASLESVILDLDRYITITDDNIIEIEKDKIMFHCKVIFSKMTEETAIGTILVSIEHTFIKSMLSHYEDFMKTLGNMKENSLNNYRDYFQPPNNSENSFRVGRPIPERNPNTQYRSTLDESSSDEGEGITRNLESSDESSDESKSMIRDSFFNTWLDVSKKEQANGPKIAPTAPTRIVGFQVPAKNFTAQKFENEKRDEKSTLAIDKLQEQERFKTLRY